MARRKARRMASSYGVRSNSRRKSRRNTWKESKVSHTFQGKHHGKPVSWVVSKAPGHHAAAKKGWSKKRKPAVVVAAAPKARRKAPAKRAAPKRMTKRASAVKRASPKRARRASAKRGASKPRRNRRHRRNAPRRRNRRSSVVVMRRNPSRRKARRNKRHARKNTGRRISRRNRKHRRNGVMDMMPQYIALALGLGAAAYVGNMIAEKIADKAPEALKEYVPAIVTAAAAAGLVMAAKKLKAPEKFIPLIMAGGAAAAVVQLIAHVRVNTAMGQQSLAQWLGLPFSSIHPDMPAPAAAPAVTGAPSGVAGLGRLGQYGMFGLNGLGTSMINVDGRPLAVQGYTDVAGLLPVPGSGNLVVEGVGDFIVGDVFSDSVLGTQAKPSGPAENPFAPGIRDGERGTMNEPSAAQVADSGSLHGNIFS